MTGAAFRWASMTISHLTLIAATMRMGLFGTSSTQLTNARAK